MHLAQILTDVKAHDECYKAHNALCQASHEPLLNPEKAPSATHSRGRGSTLKSNCTLVRSTSLPACGQTLSGLTSVSEDSHAGQSDISGCYASLEPNEGAKDTPTGTPNPSGGGGDPGGDSRDGSGGGGPPGDDDDGDHSSDDDKDEALNRSYKDDLAIIVKHVVDKDGGNIKVRVPDTFNGSDPNKLCDFILGCRLYFRGNKQAFRSEANQVTFAISYLHGMGLDHFEPYILGEIPEAPMMTSWAMFQAFLTEPFGILYPEDKAEEQLDLVIFPEDGKASTFFASFEKKFLKLIPKCLKKDIAHVMPKPQTHAEAKAYILQFNQCHWEYFREAVAKAKLHSHLLHGVKAPMNTTLAGSLSTPKPIKKLKGLSSYQKSNNNNASGESSNISAHHNNKGKNKPVQKPNDISKLLGADGKLLPAVCHHRFDHGLCLICGLKGHMATDCTRCKPVTG
ncbi:hypothetical protein M422DRAFT_248407 [Sphaerobolus stellatus SS14]|uniref:CCHC-type domain-containing protein n=1 Tax=Sphaerobolus stellatus (strain SS14) TaxID=990650 RepID=A0A0C9VVU2_SPHS4|nr:hypothetical protein M422DRAFT_248407 [Sphaerobolus stellatus SS14]